MTVKHELDTPKNSPDEKKGVVPRNVDPVLYKCPVLVEFLWIVVNYLWNLSVSLFLCSKVDFGCSSFVVQNWRIPPQHGNLFEQWSSWIEESFFPCQLTRLSAPFLAFAPTRVWCVCSSLLRLHSSTTPFGRPSTSLDLLHSFTPPHYSCRTSVLMRVLSQSDTNYLNGDMVGCGCHERSDQSRSSQGVYGVWGCREILIALA